MFLSNFPQLLTNFVLVKAKDQIGTEQKHLDPEISCAQIDIRFRTEYSTLPAWHLRYNDRNTSY